MIVFPMAGMSSRFQKAGFNKPKYMLPLGGGSMLMKTLSGFSEQFQSEPFLFICRDIDNTVDFIRSELAKFENPPADVQIVTLDAPTAGQAETVYKGAKLANIGGDQPLTIFNIDSHHHAFRYPQNFALSEVDGYLEVFEAEGEHWSFVKPDPDRAKDGIVLEVAEKRRISNLCSSGLYYFREAQLFYDLFQETLDKPAAELEGGERYIAPLYNRAIAFGKDIRFEKIKSAEIEFTGTPNEYREGLQKHGPRIAFCISGEIRGPAGHLKEVSQAAQALNADVFVSAWSERGRRTLAGASSPLQLRRTLGATAALMLPVATYHNMSLCFPAAQEIMDRDRASVEGELREAFPDAVIDLEPSDRLSLFLETKTNDRFSLRMLYKIWRCNQIRRAHQDQNGVAYDYVIRFRPDCLPDVNAFLSSRSLSDRVQIPNSGGNKNFVHDIYWMGSADQDDYLSALFGRAVLSVRDPWSNIHLELSKFIESAPFEAEASDYPVHGIRDDFSPVQRKEVLAQMCDELLTPCDALLERVPEQSVRSDLSDLLQLVGSVTKDQLLSRAERYAGQAEPSGPGALRALAALGLEFGQSASIETRKPLIPLILQLARQESETALLNHLETVANGFLSAPPKTENPEADDVLRALTAFIEKASPAYDLN